MSPAPWETRAAPFRPFEIRMIDGTSYRVSLVESVGYGRTRPRRRPTG